MSLEGWYCDNFSDYETFIQNFVLDEGVSDPCRREQDGGDSKATVQLHPFAGMRTTAEASQLAKNQRRNLANNRRRALVLSKLNKAPNLSRRRPAAPMYVFPSFDKCDSLVFLPVSWVSHANAGDFKGVTSLLNTHASLQCVATCQGQSMSLGTFLRVSEQAHDAYPDCMMCVHDTHVVGDSIRACLYTKSTDNAYVYDAAKNVSREFVEQFPITTRKQRWLTDMQQANFSEESIIEVNELIDQGKNLVVYGTLEWIFTFDIHTRKVVRFDHTWTLSSFKVADYRTDEVALPL